MPGHYGPISNTINSAMCRFRDLDWISILLPAGWQTYNGRMGFKEATFVSTANTTSENI